LDHAYVNRGEKLVLRIYKSTFSTFINNEIVWYNPIYRRIESSAKYKISESRTSLTIVNFSIPNDEGDYQVEVQLLGRKNTTFHTKTTVRSIGKFIGSNFPNIPQNYVRKTAHFSKS